MSEVQHLARCFHSAGGDQRPGKSTLFFIDDETLISKEWNGKSFGNEEPVTSDVRPNSTAAFLEVTDTSRRIIYISSESVLCVSSYNQDDEEWVDDEEVGIPDNLAVHPEGSLAVCQGDVIYQNPSGRLVYLDESWKSTVLPVDAVAGTPLATLFENEKASVFYVSSKDKFLHRVTQNGSGGWSDALLAKCALDGTPKRLLVARGPGEIFVAYVLARDNKLLLITAEGDGQKKVLGRVDSEGRFVPATTAESVVKTYWAPGSSGGKRSGKGGPVYV